MSKYNNVNPGQYKVGGRERPDTMAKARLQSVPSETKPRPRPSKNRAAAKRTKANRAK